MSSPAAPTLPPLPPITSLGSGSNLDLQGILDKMQDSEQLQLKVIQNQDAQVQAQISAYGKLQSALTALQTAAQKLADPATFSAVTATTTGDGFTATAQTGAVTAQYSIKVDQLASSEQLKSGAVSDRTAANGAGGTITITLGDGTTKDIAVGSDSSLNGIAKSINADDSSGVSASIINDGSGNSFLMLTSKDTGTQAAVTGVSVSGNSTLQGVIGFDSTNTAGSAMSVQHAATDAKVEINGITVTSGSNTVDSSIDDVTLNLTAVAKDDTDVGSITVSSNTAGEVSAVQGFVNAYNALVGQVDSLTNFDATTKTSQPLTGDATTRNMQSTLSNALRVLNSSGTLQSIQDLGISTTPDQVTNDDGSITPAGGLVLNLDTLDSTHLHSLDDSLKSNPQDVTNVLTTLGKQVSDATGTILGPDGSLTARTAGLATEDQTLQTNFDNQDAQILTDIANVRAQFVQLDTFVSQMNSTSSFLTQQFAALSSSSSSSK